MTPVPDGGERGWRVLDALPVLVLDGAGRPRYASPALAPPDRDPATEGLDALLAPADAPAVAAAFASVVDGGAESVRVAFRGRDGGRREAVLVDCLGTDPLDGVAVFVYDPTDAPGDVGPLVAAVGGSDDAATTVERVLERASTPTVEFGCYLLDERRATLRAVSGQGAAEPPVRTALARGRATPLDAAAFPLAALRDATPAGGVAVPVGARGVLVAAVADVDALNPDLFAFVDVVAAVLALALDRRAWRETAHRRGDAATAARARAERLETVADAADRIQHRVLDAATVEGVHRALVEGLVAHGLATFAAVATVDAETEHLVPQTRAGDANAYHERVDLDVTAADPPPAVRAAVEGERVAVPDVAAGETTGAWRREALACGFRAILAVPLAVEDTVREVLTVYLDDAGALDGPLERAAERLAATGASAVNAVELRAAFLGDAPVELRLHVPDGDAPLVRLAAAAGGAVHFVSATPRSDGATRLFFTTEGDDAALARAAVPGLGEVTRLEERSRDALLAATVPGGTVATAIAALGGVVTDARATGDGMEVTVVVSRDSGVRELVDAVREVFPGTELVARRTREQSVEASRGFRDAVTERLTARQLEVLQAAYFAGYFAWPRENSSSELAATLGIAQPTFSRHLRTAERKLLGLLFEHGDLSDG